jgi:hypothetical protein
VNRTIWIGDVHGCARELTDLLDLIGPGQGDQVVFVGDMVARGPDTKRVLGIARALRALCVRGNHEHRLIVARQAKLRGQKPPRLGPSHKELLDTLDEEEWAQLEALPLALEFPEHDIRVVHAGVAPGVPLKAQQAWTLMHVRSLTQWGAPSDRYARESWAAAYHEGPHVVFGHNAQAGLQLHPLATGLDTACVYGGRLSALVLPAGVSPAPPEERLSSIVSVPSHARYVDYGPRPQA